MKWALLWIDTETGTRLSVNAAGDRLVEAVGARLVFRRATNEWMAA